MNALIVCLCIATAVAWPSGVYILDTTGSFNQYYNPLTEPHSTIGLLHWWQLHQSVLKVVDVIQLGNNGTIAAPDMNTARHYHSIALLNRRRAPDKESSSAASSARAWLLGLMESGRVRYCGVCRATGERIHVQQRRQQQKHRRLRWLECINHSFPLPPAKSCQSTRTVLPAASSWRSFASLPSALYWRLYAASEWRGASLLGVILQVTFCAAAVPYWWLRWFRVDCERRVCARRGQWTLAASGVSFLKRLAFA